MIVTFQTERDHIVWASRESTTPRWLQCMTWRPGWRIPDLPGRLPLLSAFDGLFFSYYHMVMEHIGYISTAPNLDAIFAALADSTRRAILTRLSHGQASVNEIAEPFEISQPAVSKHLKVLERAGLVEREIDEQRRPAKLKADNLAAAVAWLTDFRELWNSSFDQLDVLLSEMKQINQQGEHGE